MTVKVITGELYINNPNDTGIKKEEYDSFLDDLIELVERYGWDCTGSGFKLEDREEE